jgi:hypothetical protein
MVSITLSVPEKTREQMKMFSDVNWSAFVRSCIESKAKQLAWKQEMLAKIKEEKESGFTDWSVEMGSKLNKGISERLKRKINQR